MLVNMVVKVQLLVVLSLLICTPGVSTQEGHTELYSINGRLVVDKLLSQAHETWMQKAHVYVNGGQFIGIPDRDGSFQIAGLSSASYVVEVSHPTFVFPPFRVDINYKGKIRARKLNNVQPNKVEAVEYPLLFKAQGKAPYFQKREEWRITDMLMNPMVLMMVLPMLLLFLMPKMMNAADEETKKEMESSMNRLKPPTANNLPDFSETLTSWFGGGTAGNTGAKAKKRR